MNKLITSIFIASLSISAIAQTEEQNYVPNGSFEVVKGKVKEEGEIKKAYPWKSGSTGTPDLFMKEAKEPTFGIDENVRGNQEAKLLVPSDDRFNYAGINCHNFKKDSPYEYLQIELKSPLTAGETYHVEFWVSLGELSKYSINRMGAYFAPNVVEQDNDKIMAIKPQIQNIKSRQLDEMNSWQVICGEFTAVGNEQVMIIGNFGPANDVREEKVIKPKGIKGTPQAVAYYFIDEVQVYKSSEMDDQCRCSKLLKEENKTKQMNFDYAKVISEEEKKISPAQLIENKFVQFAGLSSEISAEDLPKLKYIADLLSKNGKLHTTIIAKVDKSEEKDNTDLKDERAQKVFDYFILNGVCSGQLKVTTEVGATANNPKDRTVSFKVIEKLK